MKDHGFNDLTLDHVKFYVDGLPDKVSRLSGAFGLGVYATSGFPDNRVSHAHSVSLGAGWIRFVLSEAQTQDHPGRAYVQAHGDGVSDIAIRTDDARLTFTDALRRGARPVAEPTARDGIVTAAIAGFGDVVHTLVERPAGLEARALPGATMVDQPVPAPGIGLGTIDHFAVCVEAGQLDPTESFYRDTLGFRAIFEERIVVGEQAMNSKVVQCQDGTITFTVIEPDTSREPGQIDEFLKNHGGAGVQHIALTSNDIVSSIDALRSNGVKLLDTPDSYYDLLPDRIDLSKHSVEDLRQLNILVDEDHDGQLFQIFTRSAHPRRTFFFEIIERQGATTFGSGNIKALYEAVEFEHAGSE